MKHSETVRELPIRQHSRGWLILSPLVVFFLLYVGVSIASGDFYTMPVTAAFLAASAWALIVSRPSGFMKRVERFSAGAAHRNIMMMIWIFIMAGAFAAAAKYIGAVDATVNLTLALLPGSMVLAGMFLAACIISLSMGTSVGTIVALMPVAAGLADKGDLNIALISGAVVGGAFFGDNLSFISDTTIAATRTQGCSMKDKFRANFRIVMPAAVGIFFFYILLGLDNAAVVTVGQIEWVRVIPYLLVLVTAICGMNVMLVLTIGILSTGLVALCSSSFGAMAWTGALGNGIVGMGELIIVTLLAGGMLELIRYNGGLSYIIRHLTAGVHGRKGSELSIALMVSLANVCTANNTVAIVTMGDIARRISRQFGIPAPRAASLLDTFSCVIQGLLPYGAQLLMASAIAHISALDIIPYLYYPFVMGLVALGFIIFRRNKAD
ncbi:MAG: Na+/H+ antiporter NhaC family protein [Akkermansia sp.]|nr:Na+/H+ antiporter NhaC family protein [Akkermansia sp.]